MVPALRGSPGGERRKQTINKRREKTEREKKRREKKKEYQGMEGKEIDYNDMGSIEFWDQRCVCRSGEGKYLNPKREEAAREAKERFWFTFSGWRDPESATLGKCCLGCGEDLAAKVNGKTKTGVLLSCGHIAHYFCTVKAINGAKDMKELPCCWICASTFCPCHPGLVISPENCEALDAKVKEKALLDYAVCFSHTAN
jgi:hypothetical protein